MAAYDRHDAYMGRIDGKSVQRWRHGSCMRISAFATAHSHICGFADRLQPSAFHLILNSYVRSRRCGSGFISHPAFAFSLATTLWNFYILRRETELASFRHLARLTGYPAVFVTGIPFYAFAGWADQHEIFLTATGSAVAAGFPHRPHCSPALSSCSNCAPPSTRRTSKPSNKLRPSAGDDEWSGIYHD